MRNIIFKITFFLIIFILLSNSFIFSQNNSLLDWLGIDSDGLWVCPQCGARRPPFFKSTHLASCPGKPSGSQPNTGNPQPSTVTTQPNSMPTKPNSVPTQSNSVSWSIQATPSPVDSYKVVVTAPFTVTWNKIKAFSGTEIKLYDKYTGFHQYVTKWTFLLPPAKGDSITFKFQGEKPNDIPVSNLTGPTPSKQKIWISKTFPIAIKATIPVPSVGSASYDAITPPDIVPEDLKCAWTVDNPSDILLKLDTDLNFRWSFPNPKGAPVIRSGKIKVDKNTTAKALSSRLRTTHIFKDAGIFNIDLNLKFIEVIQNGDVIEYLPRDYNYSKTIVVVEHIPEYIGNIHATINPPKIVTEDVESHFQFSTMFSFTRLLPDNALKIVDRFEGIEPGTIMYCIDWGDGSKSPLMDYPGTDRTTIGTNPSPSVKHLKIEGITHKYLNPGNYTIRLNVTYSEKHYEKYPIVSDTGQIIGYDHKILGPFTHIATKKITVWDQTPPVIVNGSFSDLDATSGDPLEIIFEVSDNHPTEPISSARIHYMFYSAQWKGNDTPEEWKTIDAKIESIGNNIWSVSGQVHIPADFATKNFDLNPLKDMKTLRYSAEITDGSGLVNMGDSDIIDNHDFNNKYNANGVDYGVITVTDNDPPNITVVLNCKQDKRIFTFEAVDGEYDFIADPPVHGKVKKCHSSSHGSSACEMITLTEDPVSGKNPSTIIPIEYVSDDYNLREDTRIKLHWTVNDIVDGPLSLKSEKLTLNDNNIVFTTSGIHKVDFYAFDNKNPDGTSNGRKLLIDLNIQKLLMSRKELGNK